MKRGCAILSMLAVAFVFAGICAEGTKDLTIFGEISKIEKKDEAGNVTVSYSLLMEGGDEVALPTGDVKLDGFVNIRVKMTAQGEEKDGKVVKVSKIIKIEKDEEDLLF